MRLARVAVGAAAVSILTSGTARADALDDAQYWLDLIGMPVPPGYNVKYNSAIPGGALARTYNDLKLIEIDLDNLQAYAPGLQGDPANMPLVLAAILMHELFHTPPYGGWSGSTCHHIALAQMVADGVSDLINMMASEGFDVANLCDLYEAMRDNFNNGSDPAKGGACEQGAALGCTEDCEDLPENSNC